MKQLLAILVVFSLILASSFYRLAAAEEKGGEAVLESISYEKDADGLEKIIFKLNGAYIPKVFKIKGERPRLVFDFLDTRYSDLINRITDPKGNLIKGVRVGIHNDPPKTRVVVDLEPEEKFKFEQDFQVQENILSITFYPNDTEATGEKAEKAAVSSPAPPKQKNDASQKSAEIAEMQKNEGEKQPVESKKQEAVKEDTSTLPTTSSKKQEVEPSSPAESQQVAADKPVLKKKDGSSRQEESVAKLEKEDNPILAQVAEEKTAPVDPILKGVSFDRSTTGSEMVLFRLNEFHPPIVFGIEKGNPRVVCDFLDTALGSEVHSTIRADGDYVNRIRVARHTKPVKVRVVLDLVPNRNYDLQQVFFKEDNLFVIIIDEFEEEPVPTAELDPASLPKP